jgi:hypothetical protein
MSEGVHQTVWVGWNGSGIAPHAATQRATYTVPSNYRARAAYISLYVVRTTAPSTAGESRVYVTVTPAGGSETTILISGINTNSVGARAGTAHSDGFVLKGGDVLKIYSSDASTGGNNEYLAQIQLVLWR